VPYRLAELAALVGGFLALIVLLEKRDYRREQDKRCGEGKRASGNGVRTTPNLDGTPETKHPSDGEHRTAEQRNWTRQNLISVVTLFFTLVAAAGAVWSYVNSNSALVEARKQTNFARIAVDQYKIQASEAKIQTGIAAQALVTADRPWVDADVKVTRLVIDKDQISIWFSFTYRNVGRSPAQQVSAMPHVILTDRPSFSPAKADCDGVKDHPNLIKGNAVFPGSAPPTTIETGIPMREVKAFSNERYASSIRDEMQAFPEDLTPEYQRGLEKDSRMVSLGVVGCVSYFIAGSEAVHQTAFVYDLTEANPTSNDARAPIDTTVMGEIAAGSLRMDKRFIGSFAN
jgi:hypothetical protein